jgi:hypothetical protein
MVAGGWSLAECCVAVGALTTITALLRRARPALPRLLPDSAQTIDKFYTRTVDAAGRVKASARMVLTRGDEDIVYHSPSCSLRSAA